MLKSLYIKNFVLIDQLRIEFDQGFSAFIGETGAGKSILIDAIGLVSGDRSSSDVISHGQSKAIIEAEFDISNNPIVNGILDEYGFEAEDNLVLTREISLDGKSTSRVNHRSVNLSVLKELGENLIDIHSQFDTMQIKNKQSYLILLDRYANHQSLINKYQQAYQKYKETYDEFERFKHSKLNVDDLDVLYFNQHEIEELNLKENEIQELEAKSKLLAANAKILAKGEEVSGLLKGDNGALDQLYMANKALSSLSELAGYEDFSSRMEELYYNLDDLYEQFMKQIQINESDEAQQNIIEERLYKINRILRKYNTDEAGLNMKLDEIKKQISQIEHRQDYIDQQTKLIDELYQKALVLANELHSSRMKNAKKFEKEVINELQDLSLPNAVFKVVFNQIDLCSNGIDDISFMITMNKGEELRPLEKSASGGELSRFMLGLKVILSRYEAIETLIFDEIDSGISGATSFAIGHKLKSISNKVQVFSVTHLAQVAASADNLYFISKQTKQDKTVSSISKLENDEVYNKLALIGFGSVNDKSIEAAKELYKQAKCE